MFCCNGPQELSEPGLLCCSKGTEEQGVQELKLSRDWGSPSHRHCLPSSCPWSSPLHPCPGERLSPRAAPSYDVSDTRPQPLPTHLIWRVCFCDLSSAEIHKSYFLVLVEFFVWLGLVVLVFLQGSSLKKWKLLLEVLLPVNSLGVFRKMDSLDHPFFPKRPNETTPHCSLRFTRPSSFGIKLSCSPCGNAADLFLPLPPCSPP